jgi:hypothetical protein
VPCVSKITKNFRLVWLSDTSTYSSVSSSFITEEAYKKALRIYVFMANVDLNMCYLKDLRRFSINFKNALLIT